MTSDNLPSWRASAPAGLSLSAAMARHPVSAAPATRRLDPDLTRILRPEAAPRWRSARVSTYTPQYVEIVLQNGLAGDLAAQWELFDLMEDTWPRLAKALGELKRQVAAMKWTVEPWAEDDEPASPAAQERARLVSHAIWQMRPEQDIDETAFTGIVYDLLDAWGKGVSVVELMWEERDTRKLGRIITPRAGQWVHPDNYGVDNDGRLGLRPTNNKQRTTNFDPLPPYKFLVGIARAKTSHFLGAALLRPLAWWWAASNFSAQWLLNYAQLFGVPVRWATFPAGASDALIGQIGTALTNMGSSGWAAFPEGTSLNLHEGAKGAGASPQDGIIDRADEQCDLLILGQTLTTDTQGTGSNALGKVHERVRGEILQSAADWVAGVLTRQLVPAILELNYGDAEEAPELVAESVREVDQAANATQVSTLLAAGIALPRSWLYEHLDIPEPGPDDEVVTAPSPASPAPRQTPQDDPDEPGGDPDTPEPEQRVSDEPQSAAEGRRFSPPRRKTAQRHTADTTDAIAERRAGALGAAYSGAMAPFRAAILASTSPEDAIQRVAALFLDWKPERVARLVEEALQITAAAGAAGAIQKAKV
jgi:phage gp29-like protein